MLRAAISNDPHTGTSRQQEDLDGISYLHQIGVFEPCHFAPLNRQEERFEQWLTQRAARDQLVLQQTLREAKVQDFLTDHQRDWEQTQAFVQRILDRMAAVQKAEADEWLREARERLEKSDAVVTRSERRIFAERGVLRGRRRR